MAVETLLRGLVVQLPDRPNQHGLRVMLERLDHRVV